MNFVLYEVKDRVAYLTINRPEKRNALNHQLVAELKEALDKAATDENAKVVVIKANGEVFCAGADLEYMQSLQNNSYEENLIDSTHLMELFKKIYTLDKVVIAKVNGHAIAGGAGLVSVCDFAFSVEDANYGYSEVKIGFIPAIVMVFLVRKIGEAKAKELLLTGKFISAKEAEQLGLITQVVEKESHLDKTVTDFAQKLCTSNSAQSMQLIKRMMSDIQGKSLEDSLSYAAEMNAHSRSTVDCKRGIASFLDKKKLEW